MPLCEEEHAAERREGGERLGVRDAVKGRARGREEEEEGGEEGVPRSIGKDDEGEAVREKRQGRCNEVCGSRKRTRDGPVQAESGGGRRQGRREDADEDDLVTLNCSSSSEKPVQCLAAAAHEDGQAGHECRLLLGRVPLDGDVDEVDRVPPHE